MSPAPARDWQRQSIEALAGLTPERCPAAEILFLDGLAVQLMGPDAPVAPYTIEHGSAAVQHLLRSLVDSAALTDGDEPESWGTSAVDSEMDSDPIVVAARAALVEGAHAFAQRGGPGVQQLVTRFVAAATGELEIHQESPEAQTRSLFYFGLLALGSGPDNRISQDAADGIVAIFTGWDARIGAGFVPPWRIVQPV